jgi:hypothetical protein
VPIPSTVVWRGADAVTGFATPLETALARREVVGTVEEARKAAAVVVLVVVLVVVVAIPLRTALGVLTLLLRGEVAVVVLAGVVTLFLRAAVVAVVVAVVLVAVGVV